MKEGSDTPRKRWHRPLDEEDRALWDEVKRGVKRLDGKAPVKNPAAKKPKTVPLVKISPPRPKPPAPEILAQIDRGSLRKLKAGRLSIDDRLDLHGFRQEAAHRALEDFLENARESGLKLVLVITGKGSLGETSGILRKNMPLWLQSGRMAQLVSSFSAAAHKHGGAGAFYIRLRRKRQ